MLTLITGPDAYLSRTSVRRIRDEHDPEGFNTSVIDARTASIQEIVSALGTPGFFGSTRVVLIQDLMTVSSKGTTSDDDSDDSPKRAGKSNIEWTAIFNAIQPGNVAIFVDRDLFGLPAAVKRALPTGANTISGDPPRGMQLVSWMKERAAGAGSSLADMDARMLAELLSPGTWSAKPSNPAFDRPPDLEMFSNEIEKLALSAHPGPIERSHIIDMTNAGQPDRLFPLIDAVIASEGTQAVRELSAAMSRGDDAGRIAAQIHQQVELLAAMSTAGNSDPADVGRALGLSNPNRMHAISKSLQRLRSRPSSLLLEAINTERQFKSGALRQPVDQVYSVIERTLSLGRRTREGGT